jgi:hypothetical protein
MERVHYSGVSNRDLNYVASERTVKLEESHEVAGILESLAYCLFEAAFGAMWITTLILQQPQTVVVEDEDKDGEDGEDNEDNEGDNEGDNEDIYDTVVGWMMCSMGLAG